VCVCVCVCVRVRVRVRACLTTTTHQQRNRFQSSLFFFFTFKHAHMLEASVNQCPIIVPFPPRARAPEGGRARASARAPFTEARCRDVRRPVSARRPPGDDVYRPHTTGRFSPIRAWSPHTVVRRTKGSELARRSRPVFQNVEILFVADVFFSRTFAAPPLLLGKIDCRRVSRASTFFRTQTTEFCRRNVGRLGFEFSKRASVRFGKQRVVWDEIRRV